MRELQRGAKWKASFLMLPLAKLSSWRSWQERLANEVFSVTVETTGVKATLLVRFTGAVGGAFLGFGALSLISNVRAESFVAL